VFTGNEAGYVAGDVVIINYDRNYFNRKKTVLEKQRGTVTKVTWKCVWVKLPDDPSPAWTDDNGYRKRNHNVTLVKPLAGAEFTECGRNGRMVVVDRSGC
jgi:hypothetical protein